MNALQCSTSMNTYASFASLSGAAAALWLAAFALGQVPGDTLAIRSIAEGEFRSRVAGREVVKLIPADRVVPGDRVIYTLEVRNTGATPVDTPIVPHPVPEPTPHLPDSPLAP